MQNRIWAFALLHIDICVASFIFNHVHNEQRKTTMHNVITILIVAIMTWSSIIYTISTRVDFVKTYNAITNISRIAK
jgi:hypothetical protein